MTRHDRVSEPHTTHDKAGWVQHKFVWLDRTVKLAILAVVLALLGGLIELVRWAV